jgi:hypothetical protein
VFKQGQIKRWVAVAVAVAAAGFPPVAAAMPAEDPPAQSSAAYDVAISQPSSTNSSSFDWGDAGIGAAGVVVLMGAGAATTVSVRRRRVRLATS